MTDLLVRRHDSTRVRAALPRNDLIAAASIVMPSRGLRLNKYPWQEEAWNFFREGVGAFKYAMLWHGQTMSRVRLTAAVMEPGGEEPSPITDPNHPASQLIRQFFGGVPGQSQYMFGMDIQLQVPGEGYVVGEYDMDDPDIIHWCVKSTTEMNVTTGRDPRTNRPAKKGPYLWQTEVDEGVWKTLPEDTHVFKQWIADQEKSWRPDSPTRGALRTLRTIDMLERRIIAQAVSRLASNGVLLYPQEVTFPPKPGFENAADPFIAEWLDIASKVIDNPGSAQAAIPMPVKVPNQYIDSFKHIDFANTFDERLVELLNHEYDQLATAMNMPKEVVTGMGETSHWNAWTLDEQGIEVHIKPAAETICHGATKGYLHPALKSVGEKIYTSDGELVVWYDTSELDVPPDRSAAADEAYDRGLITTDAYRDAKGFGSGDEPTKKEQRDIILLHMALSDPTNALAAIEELTGSPVAGATTGPGGVEAGAPADQTPPATGPATPPSQPGNQPAQPPPPTAG